MTQGSLRATKAFDGDYLSKLIYSGRLWAALAREIMSFPLMWSGRAKRNESVAITLGCELASPNCLLVARAVARMSGQVCLEWLLRDYLFVSKWHETRKAG